MPKRLAPPRCPSSGKSRRAAGAPACAKMCCSERCRLSLYSFFRGSTVYTRETSLAYTLHHLKLYWWSTYGKGRQSKNRDLQQPGGWLGSAQICGAQSGQGARGRRQGLAYAVVAEPAGRLRLPRLRLAGPRAHFHL